MAPGGHWSLNTSWDTIQILYWCIVVLYRPSPWAMRWLHLKKSLDFSWKRKLCRWRESLGFRIFVLSSHWHCFVALVTLIVQVLWSYRPENRSINQLWVTFWSRLVWLPDRQTDWPPGGTRGHNTLPWPVGASHQHSHMADAELSPANMDWVLSWGHSNTTTLFLWCCGQTTMSSISYKHCSFTESCDVWSIVACFPPELLLWWHHGLTDTDKQLFPALHQLPMIYQNLCQPIVSHLPKNRHRSVGSLKLK